jgi:hypothetical protein
LWGGLKLSLEAKEDRRDYEDRGQRDIFGRPVEGENLVVDKSSFSLGLNQGWGKYRTLNTSLKLQYLENRDNGSGYYDYDQWSFDLSVSGDWKGIESSFTLGVDESKFLVQAAERFTTISRRKTDYWGELLVAKKVSKRLSLVLLVEYEESNSNVVEDEYDGLSGSLSFQIDIWEGL